jgi:2-hydroxycyclohexanecarboxyl-CoA dehydrogenase
METQSLSSPSIQSVELLRDKVALITAGTSGIGAESARHLALAGIRAVAMNGRDEGRGRALEARLRAEFPGTAFLFIQGDVRDHVQAGQVVDRAVREFGRLDVLLHCGGAQIKPDIFINTDPATFQPMIDGHFTSLLHCCHHAIPHLRASAEAGAGAAIIAIASDAGKVATPAESIIGATKAAAIMFIRTLALELSRFNVRANVITPSLVKDTISQTRVMSSDIGKKVFEKATARARLGLPSPADIAPLVVFLASPLASKITGQAVSVNGGISAA